MELRHIRYFIAVAEELNFSRAASRLHIAQPPLSLQIRQLEEELGLTLFERGKRPLRLTDSGRFFYSQSLEILAKLEESIAGAQRIVRGRTGWLGVGYVGAAMNALLPTVLQRFRAQNPQVEVQLFEMLKEEQETALLDRRIDIGLFRPPLGDKDLIEEKLYDEPLAVAVPADHRLARRRAVSMADLVDEPVVLYGNRAVRGVADSCSVGVFRNAGVTPRIAVEVQSADAALGLVAAGLGVALIASSFAATGRTGVRFLQLSGAGTTLPMAMSYHPSRRAPVVDGFLRLIREEALLYHPEVEPRLAS